MDRDNARPRQQRDPSSRDVAAISVAVAGYALAFGAVAATAGMSVGGVAAMSVVANSGGAQFAYVGALIGGAPGAAAVVSALIVNLRLALYGTAVQHLFGRWGWRRAAAAHLVGDENVALAVSVHAPHQQRRLFWTAGVALFIVWVAASTIGAWAGSFVSDPSALGLDVVFPAVFVGLLHPMIRRRQGRAAAGIGILVALATTPIASPGIPLVFASLAGALIAVRFSAGAPTIEGET